MASTPFKSRNAAALDRMLLQHVELEQSYKLNISEMVRVMYEVDDKMYSDEAIDLGVRLTVVLTRSRSC